MFSQEEQFGLIPDMEWIAIENLTIDPNYQRDTLSKRSQANIARMCKNFTWAKCTPLTVADLGTGKFAIIDGQHRYAAAKILDIKNLPCWILPMQKTKDQAQTFIGINQNRVAITAYAVYNAEIAAGNPIAIMVNEFCRKNNIIIPKKSSVGNIPNVTNALSTITSLLKKGMEQDLSSALALLRQAFPFKAGQLKASIIKALVIILRANGKNLVSQTMVEALRSFEDVSNIINKARELSSLDNTVTTDIAIKKIILNRYCQLSKKAKSNA